MEEKKETIEEFQERIRKQYGPMYFDRQGKEITLVEWGNKCEDMSYKILKQEEIGKYFVSSAWVGLNMIMFKNCPPLIFETMIFLNDKTIIDDPLDHYQERFSTEEEAFKGHEKAMALCRGRFLLTELREQENEKINETKD